MIEEPSSHIDYLVYVFYENRAFSLTSAARGAGPYFFFRDYVAHELDIFRFLDRSEYREVFVRVIPRLYAYHSGRKLPPDRIGRAIVRAPAAVRTGIEIQHMLPGELLEARDAALGQIHPVRNTALDRFY